METTLVSLSKKLKYLLLMVGALIIAPAISRAQTTPKYLISGICEVSKNGELYIYLVDEATFKKPMTGVKMIKKAIDLKTNSNKIEFKFDDVPYGSYGIRCFIDTDKNEILNKGMFGPTEPWGMSFKDERPMGFPSFSDISFNLNKPITDLVIQVK